MRYIREKYLNDELNLDKKQIISIICLVIVFGGVFGFIYEYIFYYFNGGMNKFYWRGGNFLPWINIYAIGSIMILILTNKCKKNPFYVFLISFLSTGILEYLSGYVIFNYLGVRYWDYNTEILNFMNIDGFVCLRSVLFFGLSSLFLVYLIMPFLIHITSKFDKKKCLIICLIICSIFLFDEFYNLFIHKLLGLKDAIEIYKSLGFNFMSVK